MFRFLVTGCANCPLRNEDNEQGDACNHPEEERRSPNFSIPWPEQQNFVRENCPLKKEPLTLIASFK